MAQPGDPGVPVAAVTARAQLEAMRPPGDGWSPRPGSLREVPDPPTSVPRRAAVLVLFGVLDTLPAISSSSAVSRDLDVLLTRRADTLDHHPGQISFPGGRIEAHDRDPAEAALREAVEETGLDPAGVDVLATLPDVPLVVSNYLVTPVTAWWASPSRVVAVDHDETVEVFRVPVAGLLDPDHRRTATWTRGRSTSHGPAFLTAGHVVWGFTAFVLASMFDVLGWTEPWDDSRTIPAPR